MWRPAVFAMSSRREASPRTRTTAASAPALAACLVLSLLAQGCSSGSGGSDVGAHEAAAPTARVQVLNGGPSNTFREGADVLLTGKGSEDSDGPPIAWRWRQTAGPSVQLLEANSTTVRINRPTAAPATR